MACGEHGPRRPARRGAHRPYPRETFDLRRSGVRRAQTRDRRHGARRARSSRCRRWGARPGAPPYLDVFVHPVAQRSGVGSSLVHHLLDAARSLGYQRAGVWTYSDNTPARGLYEGVGMTATGDSARVFTRTQVKYECLLDGPSQVPQGARDAQSRAKQLYERIGRGYACTRRADIRTSSCRTMPSWSFEPTISAALSTTAGWEFAGATGPAGLLHRPSG